MPEISRCLIAWLLMLGMVAPASAKPLDAQPGDDITDRLQAQLDQDKEAILPAGEFLLSRTINLPSGARLQGAGKGRTILKLRAGTNDDAVRTAEFARLAGTAAIGSAPSDFVIDDLTLDGNYLENRWNAGNNRINNSSGSCLRIYGKRFQIDVEVRNCAEHGLYLEGQGLRGGEEIASTVRVVGQVFGKEAMVFRGPGDSVIEHAVLGLAGILPKPQQMSVLPTSTLYPDYGRIDGVVIDRTPPYEGTAEIGFMHVYAAWDGVGLRTRGNPRFQARQLISESNLGGIAISPSTWGGIDLLDIHSNGKSVPGFSAPPKPLEGVLLESRGPFNVNAGIVHRTVGSGENWTAARITGKGLVLRLSLRGNVDPETGALYAGDGVIVAGSDNVIEIAASRINGRALVVDGNNNQIRGSVTETSGGCLIRGRGNAVSLTGDAPGCR